MNIGIWLHDTRPGTLEERLASAAAQGFSCVQLAMSKAVPAFRMADAPKLLTGELAAEVKQQLDRVGMECAVLGCYLKLAGRDGEEAARIREIYLAHLQFAAMIGARCVGTETPSADGLEGKACRTEEHYRLFLDRVRPVARAAEELGVTLAVEPVCSHIIHDVSLAEKMLEDLKSDRVRIILDAVNLIDSEHVGEADSLIREAVSRLGDRVCVLHMKDFIPQPDAPRPRPVPCGQGQMQYRTLLKLAWERDLPITLENTTPENAEQTRIWMESQA